MYNFDLHLPETINCRKHRYQNKYVKSISIQKNPNQITSDTRCITDDSPTNLQPLLCGSITERQIIQKYRPTIIHRQIQSDNLNPIYLRRSILPSIAQSFTDRISIEPRNNTPKQDQTNNDKLSVKKLNALLGKKKLEHEKLRQDYPHLPEMQDFSKRMQNIYKRNNINPLKLRIPQQEQTRCPQQIDILINLLKKRN